MPYKKKKTYRKKRSYTTRQSTPAISPTQVVTLKYVDHITINPPSGLPGSYVFSANSIFDPSFSGTGHQPLGRDEWEKFYDHYTVIGSKITANFFSDSAVVTQGNAMVGILLKDNTTAISGLQTLMEQSLTHPVFLTNAAAGGARKVSKGYSAKKFFGLQSIKDNRTVVGSQFAASPADGAYFHVYVAPVSTTDDVGTTSVVIQIEYTCLLTERKALVGS